MKKSYSIIKLYLTKEEKKLIKKAAAMEDLTVHDFILNAAVEKAKKIKMIPKGHYCYSRKGMRVTACPHWKEIKGKSLTEDGYCAFLGLGDGELHPTAKNGNGKPYKVYLLFDRVKQCDINIGKR